MLRNFDTFVNAGGFAKVKSILFAFNEHQIVKMKERFDGVEFLTQQSMYYPKTGLLSAPSHIKHNGSIAFLNSISERRMTSPKSCPWQDGKWLLINELGEVHTCCYLLTFIAGMKDRAPKEISKFTSLDYYGEVYDLYVKNKEAINLNNVCLTDAYENEYNRYVRKNYKNIERCKLSCGISEKIKEALQGTI